MLDDQSNTVQNEPEMLLPVKKPIRKRGRKKIIPGVTCRKVARSPLVFVLDDSSSEVAAINAVLEGEGMFCKTFTSPQECIDCLRTCACDVLVTDLKMPEMDGMDVLIEALKICPDLPVVVITGYGNISMAVVAMKNGAKNFIEKPFDRMTLLDSINSAMKEAQRQWSAVPVDLTKTEKTVLKHIIHGNANRDIALAIGKSVRTVEDHRGRVMKKLGATKMTDLIKRCIALGLA
jgi:two-component system response regulator FixJ